MRPLSSLPRPQRPRRSDDGTALVEFALISVLFLTLLFGIINMGVLLSFKQNLTQAASESARAAVAVIDETDLPSDPGNAIDERYQVVDTAFGSTIAEFDKSCGTSGITCRRVIHDCESSTDVFNAIPEQRNADPACLTVRIEYDNSGSNRIMPAFPLVSALEPDSLSSQTTVRLVPVSL